MSSVVKNVWIVTIVISSIALLLSLFVFVFKPFDGLTDGFILFFVFLPTLIFTIISTIFVVKDKIPNTFAGQIFLVVLSVVFLVIFSGTLLWSGVEKIIITEGQARTTERVDALWHSPSGVTIVYTTDDGKFEYFLEIINSGQRNSRAQLFLRDVATGEEARILLDTGREILRIMTTATPNEAVAWAHLVPSEDSPFIYILTTTQSLNFDITSFEICTETKTSRRIE